MAIKEENRKGAPTPLVTTTDHGVTYVKSATEVSVDTEDGGVEAVPEQQVTEDAEKQDVALSEGGVTDGESATEVTNIPVRKRGGRPKKK